MHAYMHPICAQHTVRYVIVFLYSSGTVLRCMQELEALDGRLAQADGGPDGDYLDQIGRLMTKYDVQLPKIYVSKHDCCLHDALDAPSTVVSLSDDECPCLMIFSLG